MWFVTIHYHGNQNFLAVLVVWLLQLISNLPNLTNLLIVTCLTIV